MVKILRFQKSLVKSTWNAGFVLIKTAALAKGKQVDPPQKVKSHRTFKEKKAKKYTVCT